MTQPSALFASRRLLQLRTASGRTRIGQRCCITFACRRHIGNSTQLSPLLAHSHVVEQMHAQHVSHCSSEHVSKCSSDVITTVHEVEGRATKTLLNEPHTVTGQSSQGVLPELLHAVFRDADADNDGFVSMAELDAFLNRHRIEHVSPLIRGFVKSQQLNGLGLDDFKTLLFMTRLFTMDGSSATSLLPCYGVHRSLFPITCGSFFDQADINKDGQISTDELVQLFAALGLGEAEEARTKLEQYASSAEDSLSKAEFSQLLLGERLLTVQLSAAQYYSHGL
eukprot:CAMPEP_0119326448 /NCGR_PEP_ID=MMETSP1333-20130426/68427_1 /TAXON_ID=418940 /ORGANISM="Scyphosphaera apsteinii, Strain RCC1455" /LENGTH=280 /DNA_ID=CAMNT_0007334759 /DNA_START=32 /DNA_END=874 /DNA_ORIENTATION=+